MPGREAFEPQLHRWPFEPAPHGFGAQLNEQPLAAVLHRREPLWLKSDLGPLDINDNIRWSDLKGTGETRPTIIDRDFVVATVAAPTKAAEVVAEPGAAPVAAPAGGTRAPGKTPAGGTKAPSKPAAKK